MTHEPAQKPTHKDLGRNGQNPAITSKAAYAPVSNRAGSRSTKRRYDIWS
ncbi:acetyltransferase [Lacticaseibacillus paracasei]|nr:acetyltransferase [Lacticaseibacillus paracasei]